MQTINELTSLIIGLAIEVHRELGPGLSEAAYEEALCIELTAAKIGYQRQIGVPVFYKGLRAQFDLRSTGWPACRPPALCGMRDERFFVSVRAWTPTCPVASAPRRLCGPCQ